MSNKVLMFLCALIVSACAGTPEGSRARPDSSAGETKASTGLAGQDEWETYCVREKVLGSNLPEKVCYRRRATSSQ